MKQFTKILISFSILFTFNIVTSSIRANASDNNYDNEIEQIYQHGKDKGIINDNNMPYNQFNLLMKNSVIPAYENNKNNIPNFNKSLDEFTSDDNYEVAPGENSNNTVNGYDPDDEDIPSFKIGAKDGYKMKPGDILICYGTDSTGVLIGHAAIAKSNNEILHMPGPGLHAQKWNKKEFFSQYAQSNKGKWVQVYRPTNYADAQKAGDYAYNNMYLNNTNPAYWLEPILNDKMHSYCSKYVYLAYLNTNSNELSKIDTVQYMTNYIPPHSLPKSFNSIDYLHKVTKY